MSERSKVKVSREVAEALEKGIEAYGKGRLLEEHFEVKHGGDKWFIDFVPLNALSIVDMAIALTEGYEIEQTPEENVREYYESMSSFYSNLKDPAYFYRMAAIKHTLNILGLKIEGVNAND